MSGGQEDSDGKRVGLKLRNALSLSDRGGGHQKRFPFPEENGPLPPLSQRAYASPLERGSFRSLNQRSVTNQSQGNCSVW